MVFVSAKDVILFFKTIPINSAITGEKLHHPLCCTEIHQSEC